MSALEVARVALDVATATSEGLAQACESAVESADCAAGHDHAIDLLSRFAQSELLRRAAAQTYATKQRMHGIKRGLRLIGMIDIKTKLEPLNDAAPANPHEAGLRLLDSFRPIPGKS